jgi:hypothetical protein
MRTLFKVAGGCEIRSCPYGILRTLALLALDQGTSSRKGDHQPMGTPELPARNKPVPPNEAATNGARRRYRSLAQIVLLLSAMGALLALCGWIVAGWDGVAWSMFAGTVGLVLVRRVPADMFLNAMHARPLLPGEVCLIQNLTAG